MSNFSDAIKSRLQSFLQIRFQPSADLLVVFASYLIMVTGLYATWIKFTITSAWVPISMFILGILVPITYNNLIKKRPLSETGISKKYWLGSLILGLILSVPILIAPAPSPSHISLIAAVKALTFTEFLPLLVFEITACLFLTMFFCGWVQMRFERAFGAIPAILITAAFFALHHVAYGEPISLFYLVHFIGGFIYAAIFRITRNIFIVWPFFASATSLNTDLGWGLRLPFETMYGYISVLVLMWLFIAIVHRMQKRKEVVSNPVITGN